MARLIEVWMDSWSNGPGTNPHYYRVWRITPAFEPLKQKVIGNVGSVLWVVMATIGLVMLIACTNVANLLLVRAEARQQELAMRAALGAGRARIARELLVESVVLGLLGGVLGIGVAVCRLCGCWLAMGPANLPRLSEIALDGWSLAFTLALSVAAGLVFGSIPALKYGWAQAGGIDRHRAHGQHEPRTAPLAQRAGGGAGGHGAGAAGLRHADDSHLCRTANVDPGFADAAHVQTMRISIPDQLEHDPM